FRARALVSERMETAELPEGAEVELAPEYTPLGEIYQYRLTSDRHDLYELRATQEWTVSRLFKQVPGVADVVSFGGYLKEVHVEVDPSRLQAHDLTLHDVSEALARSNLNVGGGVLRHGDQELIVRGIGYVTGAPDIQNVVLRSEGGTPVTVGDVARVLQSYTPRRGTVGLNLDREAVEGFVLLRRGENPSDVLEGVHAMVRDMNDHILPPGMRIEPFYDRTQLVSRTLRTVHHNLLFGASLIVLVVWLFLRTLRGSLIVAGVIPFSLLFAFTGLYLRGLPANLISMGAIDFGIIVDGAIILVENVVHQMRARRPATRAEGIALIAGAAHDVARPAFYSMAIIIAALIPVFTLQRVEGRIFRPLALTYSFTLVAALLAALTLVPALCGLLLRQRDAETREPVLIERLRSGYARLLAVLLRRHGRVRAGALALLAAGILAAAGLGSEFLPQLNEGDLVIFVEMPPSMSLEQGQTVLLDVRRRILAFPEVIATMSEQGRPEDGTDDEGVNMSETFVRLKPASQWRTGRTMEGLVGAMRASLTEIPGVRFNFSEPIKDNVEEAVSGVRGQVVLKIFGTDLEGMRATLQDAVTALKTVSGVVDLGIYREATV
ncbi:MAG TPA: efflux RND transporter permease subunit, partial [Candidatus Polarisedimenticolia bacterium]|nr:efflux RND transporter permease subunit [Candidatus Polarisedimenticolia bacterium]